MRIILDSPLVVDATEFRTGEKRRLSVLAEDAARIVWLDGWAYEQAAFIFIAGGFNLSAAVQWMATAPSIEHAVAVHAIAQHAAPEFARLAAFHIVTVKDAGQYPA
jgi:hypothetical protein